MFNERALADAEQNREAGGERRKEERTEGDSAKERRSGIRIGGKAHNIRRTGGLVLNCKVITLRLCDVTFLVVRLPAEIYYMQLHRVRCILMDGADF